MPDFPPERVGYGEGTGEGETGFKIGVICVSKLMSISFISSSSFDPISNPFALEKEFIMSSAS